MSGLAWGGIIIFVLCANLFVYCIIRSGSLDRRTKNIQESHREDLLKRMSNSLGLILKIISETITILNKDEESVQAVFQNHIVVIENSYELSVYLRRYQVALDFVEKNLSYENDNEQELIGLLKQLNQKIKELRLIEDKIMNVDEVDNLFSLTAPINDIVLELFQIVARMKEFRNRLA
ncbi:hypothetical protein ACFL08_05645 [Patescibacteria group bacterium]